MFEVKIIFSFMVLVSCGLCSLQAFAQDKAVGASGLPLPRFVSLQSDKINMRTGPGRRYPIEWVYKKEGLPVEITAEYDVWRRVRDFEGSEGWLHKSTLSGRRTVIVTSELANLQKRDNKESLIIATVAAGVIGRVNSCSKEWCFIHYKDHEGYMSKKDIWGVYSHELIDD